MLATSVKSDLLRDTMQRRAALGEVMVFDPTAATGLTRSHWTPLAQCRDWDSARRTADRLARAAQASQRSAQDGEFWAQAGARYLAPLLLAAALSDRSIAGPSSRWRDPDSNGDTTIFSHVLSRAVLGVLPRSSFASLVQLVASRTQPRHLRGTRCGSAGAARPRSRNSTRSRSLASATLS